MAPRPRAFTWQDLVDCYARGVFPLADRRTDTRVFLVDPEWRGVLPLESVHVPRLAHRKDAHGVAGDQVLNREDLIGAHPSDLIQRSSQWMS